MKGKLENDTLATLAKVPTRREQSQNAIRRDEAVKSAGGPHLLDQGYCALSTRRSASFKYQQVLAMMPHRCDVALAVAS